MLQRLLIAALLISACVALLATAPVAGNFWWSDAPRHALNGAFVKDMLQTVPLHDPKGWAIEYYLRYPALTILFYPPLFYFVEAGMFSLFGVSHFVAQASVALFSFVLALAAYGIARFVLPRWSALGVALLTVGAPEVSFWGRQVMLDVPSYAALVGGVFFFLRYIRDERPRDLYFAMLCTLAAIYIKLNALFIVPVLVVALIAAKGWRAIGRRHVALALVLGALGLLPALLLTLRFGSVNIESVSGRSGDLPVTSLQAWSFYAELLPRYLGFAGMALGIGGLALLLFGRIGPRQSWFLWLFAGWFALGYLFASAIGVREPRHGLMMIFPLALLAIMTVHYLLPQRWTQAVALALGGGTLLYSLLFYPVPEIDGYRAVADYVARNAPKNAIIVFSGYRDGSFIFNLRTHAERGDIATIRSDKFLLRVRVERERGVGQSDLGKAAIARVMREAGVDLIVYQPGFWEDLQAMQRFAAVVRGPDYERVASFEIGGTVGHDDRSIEIYRPVHAIPQRQKTLLAGLPLIGAQFNGSLAAQ
jgi:4-amino-4-deoxy-L-arabinose transferase-like glycosyltransferase